MSFIVNQSLSVNQRKNTRLNEYFAVVGLPEGQLLLADNFLPHLSGGSESASAEQQQRRRRPQQDVPNGGGGGDPVPRESLSPLPLTPDTARESRPRRPSFGNYDLGTLRGKGTDADGPLSARFRARVLHRFPAYDHEESPFPSNLSLFCLPGGLRLSVEMELPTFFAFVHTRANGQHMFGYCLSLYEPLEERHRSDLQKLVDAHDAWLRARRSRRRNSAVSKEEAVNGSGTGVGISAAGRNGGKGEQHEEDHLRPTLEPTQEVYAPKCLCLLSTWPYFEQFREWFLNLYRISLSPSQIPLERYISNFLLEVPTPSPGRIKVLYNMGNTTISFACPPPNKPVAWGSVPFEPLFQCLSHKNILKVFSCLLLERSLLLKSSQLSLLTSSAEVLVLLLYPFSWSHVYIPVLPEALLGVLSAPMPFLIGVHRSFVDDTGMDISPYAVEVDLDNDIVDIGMQAPRIPDLPPRGKAKLLAALAEHADLSYCRTPSFREEVMQKSDLAFTMALRPCDFIDGEVLVPPPDWDAVREAFLRFFVALFAEYRRFLVYPTKANPSPPRLFNTSDFLDKLDSEARPFAKAMCHTQAFQNFVDARIQPEEGDLDVRFFDASIVAKKNRSKLHVIKIKKDADFLRPETYVAKTVYALTPDTTGLDMKAPAKTRERFPDLSAALYTTPRDVPSISNHYKNDAGEGGGGRGGAGGVFSWGFRRGSSGDYSGSGPGAGGASTGGSKGSHSGSWKGHDDWAPLSAEATVFAVFLFGFCATIGHDPPPRAKLANGDAPSTTRGDQRHSSPSSEAVASPEHPSVPPTTTTAANGAVDQGSESSWGSGSARAPIPSDAGGPFSDAAQAAAGVGASVSPPPTAPTEDRVSASPASEDAQAAANAAGDGVTAMTCLPEDGVGQQGIALGEEATRASTGGSTGGGGRAEGRRGGKSVDGGGKAKAKTIDRKSSRLAFSDLKHDVREERMYRANAGLAVAFEALAAMLWKAPSGDEAVYRSLISACGRSGNSEKAMVVVELMMSTGIVPDAMVSRCLVDAFAMDDSFLDGRAHPLALLDWSKFRPTHRDERRFDSRISRSAGKGESTFSLKRILKRFENSAAGERSAASPVIPGTPVPATSPAAIAAAAAAAGRFDSGAVKSLSPVRPSSYGSIVGIGLSISPPNTGDTEGSRGIPSRSDAKISPAFPQSSGRFSFEEGGPWASVGQPSCPDTDRVSVRRRSFEVSDTRYSYSSGAAGSATETARKTPGLGHDVKRRMFPDSAMPPRQVPKGGAPSPYAMNGGMSLAMHQQIVLGQRLLEQLFPDLKIDNVGETCPSCLSNLSPRQVRQGWSPDPNDYTTECRAHIDLSTAKAVASGASAVAATRGTTARPSEGEEKSAASRGARGGSPAQKPVVKCGRRFVSRFSVHSVAAGWEGTTGPGTPLWCEYLSPWVLRKEFHNILAGFGVRYLCSARFREGLGPAAEAADEEIRKLSGTSWVAASGSSGGDPRPVDRTIFWNLVVHFREASLPLAFLLQDAAFRGSSAVLL